MAECQLSGAEFGQSISSIIFMSGQSEWSAPLLTAAAPLPGRQDSRTARQGVFNKMLNVNLHFTILIFKYIPPLLLCAGFDLEIND